MKDNMTLQMSLYFRGDNGSRWLFRPVRFRIPKPLLHVTPLVPMFGRDIHTMLRGLRLDCYVFPLSAIRFSQGRRFPLRVVVASFVGEHNYPLVGCYPSWVTSSSLISILRPRLGRETLFLMRIVLVKPSDLRMVKLAPLGGFSGAPL